jgi:hypothetical protein
MAAISALIRSSPDHQARPLFTKKAATTQKAENDALALIVHVVGRSAVMVAS